MSIPVQSYFNNFQLLGYIQKQAKKITYLKCKCILLKNIEVNNLNLSYEVCSVVYLSSQLSPYNQQVL